METQEKKGIKRCCCVLQDNMPEIWILNILHTVNISLHIEIRLCNIRTAESVSSHILEINKKKNTTYK